MTLLSVDCYGDLFIAFSAVSPQALERVIAVTSSLSHTDRSYIR